MKSLLNVIFWFHLIFLTLTVPAVAKNVFPHDVISPLNKAVTLPSLSTNEILSTMKEVGQAKLTKFFFDIYQSRLLVHSAEFNTDLLLNSKDKQSIYPIAFKITYLRDIKSKYLVKETVKQWQHLNISEKEYGTFIPYLSQLWPNINKDDTLLLYISNNQSVFYLNNEYLGQINNMTFGMLFLNIWLSESTSEPELRQQLLGLSTN